MKERYTIKIVCKHWSCGDGCCSDSWYYYEVYDMNDMLTNPFSDVEIHNMDICLEAAYNYAEEYYGIKDRTMFNIEYGDDYGDEIDEELY